MKTITTNLRTACRNALTGLLILAIFIPFASQSQCYDNKEKPVQFRKGDLTYNIGIGLMPSFRGKNLKNPVPPISIVFNYRPVNNVTTGFYLGYSLTESTLTKENGSRAPSVKKIRNSFYILGLRAEGHYIRGRADFYGGAMLAYNFSDIGTNLSGKDDFQTNIRVENYADVVTWSGHVGVKYLISKHIGFFTEIGYGVSLITIGTTFKY
ncbi:MAG: hypothetical protein ACI8P3_001622 [Saprospiraceae bacterium]|jgi:hypothetical protein